MSRPPRTGPSSSGASTPATAVPRPAVPDLPDLRLSVWFDAPSYLSTQLITVHARVTNVGTATASHVVVSSTGNLSITWWTPLYGAGVPIEPGQSAVGNADGYVTTTSGPVTLTVTAALLGGEQDAHPADNVVTASVPVTHLSGSYRGTVYGDRNGNGAMDPGEALAGIGVYTSGGTPNVGRTTTTDSRGRFVFRDLPAGSYWTIFDNAADWYLAGPGVVIDGVNDPDVVVRGTPSATKWLSASMAFTRKSYRKNDIARLTVTLANHGAWVIKNVTANCWATGSGELNPGDLAAGGPGVTVPAGAERVHVMTIRITDEAAAVGYLRVTCAVGVPPHIDGPPAVSATARIPGGMAPRVDGHLGRFVRKPQLGLPESTPLPGVKVYLRDQVSRAVVTRAVTDGNGDFTFRNVPAGLYDFGIVGPWAMVYSDPEFVVRDGENGPGDNPYRHYYVVVPGPYQPDPDPAPPPGVHPAPAPGPAPAAPRPPGLATTGVGVTWLALGGFLATTTGAALVLGAHRRRLR
ncbi:SdrD B-like domain-containing protein [Amycolatopsis sp. NPDC021455]|uniref:SdrD B-like domain-containing protein n=1 Tax=Amycolatopsis sp. NPDC021455 TaxID=3154901 RepID=UPI0034034384